MRSFALLVIIGLPLAALAQEPPQQPPQQPAIEAPAPAAPVVSPSPTPPRSLPPTMAERWRRARITYGAGSVIGLLGDGLTLSSVLVVAITGYPCDPNDPVHMLNPNDSCNRNSASFKPPKPTDAAPLLAYIGSSVSALGFVVSAAGLGLQHQVLGELNADPGRGVFAAGTTIGVLGFMGVGASYVFGFTHFLDSHDQGIAILASSISGAGLCLIGGILYSIDSSRMRRVWERAFTF
jgi:hypothetical protein